MHTLRIHDSPKNICMFSVQVRLDQLCSTDDGAQLEKCAVNWNGWSEVCACSDDFCNTFAYLRGSIEQHQQYKQPPNSFSDGLYGSSSSGGNEQHTDQRRQRVHQQLSGDGGSRAPLINDIDDGRADIEMPKYQSNSLIVLLVIIPLTVGGLAVCLIFVNYHCKMC